MVESILVELSFLKGASFVCGSIKPKFVVKKVIEARLSYETGKNERLHRHASESFISSLAERDFIHALAVTERSKTETIVIFLLMFPLTIRSWFILIALPREQIVLRMEHKKKKS
jgi:hypothetical protein